MANIEHVDDDLGVVHLKRSTILFVMPPVKATWSSSCPARFLCLAMSELEVAMMVSMSSVFCRSPLLLDF